MLECTYELLSCCLLAGPLWGSSWAETGRFYVILTSLCFFGRIGSVGRKELRGSANQNVAGKVADFRIISRGTDGISILRKPPKSGNSHFYRSHPVCPKTSKVGIPTRKPGNLKHWSAPRRSSLTRGSGRSRERPPRPPRGWTVPMTRA